MDPLNCPVDVESSMCNGFCDDLHEFALPVGVLGVEPRGDL